MSVVINPSSQLGFKRPFTQTVKRTVSLTNNNTQPVAFKVKTTAPKLYCVRPNSGRVDPGQTVEVQVMLQAMKDEPPLSIKCKDKFLIQSTLISPEKDSANLTELWAGDASEVQSQKIRVVYLPAEGQTVPEEEESKIIDPMHYETVRGFPSNGVADHSAEQAQPFGDSLGGADFTAPDEGELHVDAPSTPPHEHEEHPIPPPQPEEEPEEDVEDTPLVNVNVLHTPAPPTPPMPIPAPIPPVSHGLDPNDELVQRLGEAHAEIERLRNLISSMPGPSTTIETSTEAETGLGLRRRAGPRSVLSDDDDASTISPTEIGTLVDEHVAPPEGVPLQVVIIIALGVFITTYLFF